MTSITSWCEMACQLVQKKLEEKQLEEERAAKAQNWKLPVCYDDDDDEERSDSLNDNIISGLLPFSAITPNEPVLSTEEPDNSLTKDHFEIAINSNDDYFSSDDASLYNENIEYVEASPHDSELVSLEVGEIVIPEDEEIEDDNLREKLLKISSGSTTTHSDISLSEYDSFIFDLSNDQCPPTDKSDFTHEEFTDELAHIISPPEYDCFYFRDLPDPGEWISSLNSETRVNLFSTTCVNLPVEDDHSLLLAYVVWIFLAYLTYPVIPPHLRSFGNEDTIFDPGIAINRFYSFKLGLSHRCGTVKKFNTHHSHLNECPMMINGKNTPILDVPLFYFYPP
nr:hypothetical protein [Tanacetum cinerariifolium]